MPSKSYSKDQRVALKENLLKTGLQLYAEYGIRNIGLEDICKAVGISKPFFYTFFDSIQEFVVCLLDYQWGFLRDKILAIESNKNFSESEKVFQLLLQLIHHNENGILILTQDEEVWVARRLGKENVKSFLDRQLRFFKELLDMWKIPVDKIQPAVLANMILSMLIVHNSAKKSLPFLYLDNLEETAIAHAQSLVLYIMTMRGLPM